MSQSLSHPESHRWSPAPRQSGYRLAPMFATLHMTWSVYTLSSEVRSPSWLGRSHLPTALWCSWARSSPSHLVRSPNLNIRRSLSSQAYRSFSNIVAALLSPAPMLQIIKAGFIGLRLGKRAILDERSIRYPVRVNRKGYFVGLLVPL